MGQHRTGLGDDPPQPWQQRAEPGDSVVVTSTEPAGGLVVS